MKDFDINSEDSKRVLRLENLENDFYALSAITDKWGYLRQIYMEMLPWIIERARVDVVTPINVYPIDWSRYFSPIEQLAWASIRSHYMALYPQFPVFNSFIDFANPYLRIGLELDGKDYHDPIKDKIRDEMLYKHGWKIFRVTGKEANAKFVSLDIIQERSQEQGIEWYDTDDFEHWLMNTCDGVVYAIKQVYFKRNEDSQYYNMLYKTLDKHNLVHFDI